MPRKTLIVIIVGVVILLGVLVYALFRLNPQRKEALQESVKNIFPFGQIVNQVIVDTGGTPAPETPSETPSTPLPEENIAQLRQITFFPIAGFIPFSSTVKENISRTVINQQGIETLITEPITRQIERVRYVAVENSFIFDTDVGTDITQNQIVDNFIPNTERAVFSSNGMSVFLQQTVGSFGKESISNEVETLTEKPLVVEPCPFQFNTTIKFGQSGDEVKNIQMFFNQFLGISVNENSTFDEFTRNAVIAFQRNNGLTPDGSVGPQTRNAMKSACIAVQTQKAKDAQKFQGATLSTKITYLPDNISWITESVNNITGYLLNAPNSGSLWLRDMITGTERKVFTTPFREWIVEMPSSDMVYFQTKASQTIPGYLYEFNVKKRTFKKIIGDILGLTAHVSPSGQYIFSSASTNTGITTNFLNRKTGISRQLGITTFPEKCTWNTKETVAYCAVPTFLPENDYPDAWYQGRVSFSDNLWQIDMATGNAIQIYTPAESPNGFDIINPRISPSDRYLYFINKKDSTLWVFTLNNNSI